METFTGKGVYGAVAIGKISIFKRREVSVKRNHVTDTEGEKARLAVAKELAVKQLQEIYEKALKEVGEENARIFETQKVNAEYAVAVTSDHFAEMFRAMDDTYMRERAADVQDISNRIIQNLDSGQNKNGMGDHKVIICADDLAPSETVLLDKDKVLAFVTAYGSSNSHTAILARNMNIPAIISVGGEFLNAVHDGDEAIVDGFTGEIFLNPDSETVERMGKKQQEDEEKKKLLLKLKGKENITIDGTSSGVSSSIWRAVTFRPRMSSLPPTKRCWRAWRAKR